MPSVVLLTPNCYFVDYRWHGLALERAMQCEQINQCRQQLCEQIEFEAIAHLSKATWTCSRARMSLSNQLAYGVIGIVASRWIAGSRVHWHLWRWTHSWLTRGIPEFHVFEALNFCKDLLGKFGGHKSSWAFTCQRLIWKPCDRAWAPCPPVPWTRTPKLLKIDAANLNQITPTLQTDGHPPPLRHRQPIYSGQPMFGSWPANRW